LVLVYWPILKGNQMSTFQQLVEVLEQFKAGECDAIAVAMIIEALVENRIEANKS